MRLLVVEDDVTLLGQIVDDLRREGFAVDAAENGEDGLHFALEYPIDLAVLDLGLPLLSGLDLIRKVRAAGKSFPILILTARGRWQEKVQGLEAGADDYMVKPFQIEELLARVRALIRRSGGFSQSVLSCGPISLDVTGQKLAVQGEPVELTAYEFKVLEYLMLHAGEAVSKSQLMEHIYEEEGDRDSNVIEVFIRRLRSKLDGEGKLNPIETLRGRGYRFTLARTDSGK